MCTAVSCNGGAHFFGRNLDLAYSYDETITITPRSYPFHFRHMGDMQCHYALIGMTTVLENYPLYYEATNEKGLSMAGLNFPGLAAYSVPNPNKDNVASFELIPWVLGQCATVEEARSALTKLNIVDTAFSDQLAPSPLHWILADAQSAVTLEPTTDGLMIYDNPVGVLTNNPPFPWHMYNLSNYMHLSASPSDNRLIPKVELKHYCTGMGAVGLPGDWSSPSRFVRAAFVTHNGTFEGTEAQRINQFFHILSSVAMPKGSVLTNEGKKDITLYSCCCNTETGVYYYTTYENSAITAVDMHRVDLDAGCLYAYPLRQETNVQFQN